MDEDPDRKALVCGAIIYFCQEPVFVLLLSILISLTGGSQ